MHRLFARAAALIMILCVSLILTGCLASQIGDSTIGSPMSLSEAAAGASFNRVPSLSRNESYGRVQTGEFREIDFDTSRFQTEGLNAFYILPGLENVPDAMACFEVLDYNSNGEFVYFYITPAYISSEEIRAYKSTEGTSPSLNGFTEVTGRRSDYKLDAEILMSYNPETGAYRVMEAKPFELEFDPAKEGRPLYYESKVAVSEAVKNEDKHIFCEQRGFVSKVAGAEEYFLMDENCIGTVYNAEGREVVSMTYADQISGQREKVEKEMGESTSALIRSVAMSRDYETFIELQYFTKESPMNVESRTVDMTLMCYRWNLDPDSGTVFTSTDLNVDKKIEKWKSINGQFFDFMGKYENADEASRKEEEFFRENSWEGISAGYGHVYAPFTNDGNSTQNVIIGAESFPDEQVGHFRAADVQLIADTYSMSGDDRENLNYYIEEYDDDKTSDDNWLWSFTNWVGITRQAPEKLKRYWNTAATIAGKRAFRAVHSLIFSRNIRGMTGTGQSLNNVIEDLSRANLLVKAGDQPGIYQSFHILRLVQEGEGWSPYIAQVDTYPEGSYVGSITGADRGITWEPYEYVPEMTRLCYIRKPEEAKRQVRALRFTGDGVEVRQDGEPEKVLLELETLLQTSPETWTTLKYANFLNALMTHDLGEFYEELGEKLDEMVEDDKMSEKDAEKTKKSLEELDQERLSMSDRLNKALEDAQKAHEDKKLTDREYEQIYETIDRALNDLFRNPYLEGIENQLSEAASVLDQANRMMQGLTGGSTKRDMIDRIVELSNQIPEAYRESVLALCMGYVQRVDKLEPDSTVKSYRMKFPQGSGAIITEAGMGARTTGGRLSGAMQGVVLEGADNSGEELTRLTGYKSILGQSYFIEDTKIPGVAMDAAQITYRSPAGESKDTQIIVARTSEGVKIYKNKNRATDPNAQYAPLRFTNIDEAVERKVSEQKKEKKWPSGIDTRGYIPLDMLLTSGGYTRDTEGRTDEAVQEEISRLGEEQSELAPELPGVEDVSSPGYYRYSRFNGHLTSARNITLIGEDSAIICSVDSGTKLLHLNSGEVSNDMEGSYYRMFQKGRTEDFMLLGFGKTGKAYKDCDIAAAKVFKKTYSGEQVSDTLIQSFLNMLNQYAKDYLYRQFRTTINEEGEMENIDMSEDESTENKVQRALFDPASASYERALSEIAKAYEVTAVPEAVRERLMELRRRVAAVKPAIARVYELAGARSMATSPKRSDPYWRNLESRLTEASNLESFEDILVEIRMNEAVAGDLPKEQADKYREYRKVLDLSAQQGQVSVGDIFGDEGEKAAAEYGLEGVSGNELTQWLEEQGSASANEGKDETSRRAEYRREVLNDILADYIEHNREIKSVSSPNGEAQAAGALQSASDREAQRQKFIAYETQLLGLINPDNFVLSGEEYAGEFAEVINHGRNVLSGAPFEAMKKSLTEALPDIDSVWRLEELIIKEKIRTQSGYQSYLSWLEDYEERAAYDELPESLQSIGGISTNQVNEVLIGQDRIRYLRQSAAYKSIIGDIKNDEAVREMLSQRKITWEDYLDSVIINSGAGTVKDESGTPKESPYKSGTVKDSDSAYESGSVQ